MANITNIIYILLCMVKLSSGWKGIQRVPDGLLVVGGTPIRAEVAKWTVLVTLPKPESPGTIEKQLQVIEEHIQQNLKEGIVMHHEAVGWIQRIVIVRRLLTDLYPRVVYRHRRGLFNFVGDFSHSLFGTATDKSVEQCKSMVRNAVTQQKKMVHYINQMTSVLNHTQDELDVNRHQINKMLSYIQNITSVINELSKKDDEVERTLHKVMTLQTIDQALTYIEAASNQYRVTIEKHHQQKASLELGRLTESLMSPEVLLSTLQKAKRPGHYPIVPTQWYYEYVNVEPIWDTELLIYRVTLPLIDNTPYLLYQLYSWPTPYNTSGYAAKIEIQPFVGFDSTNGHVFIPDVCVGTQPKVCQVNIMYQGNQFKCERGLINGNRQEREECIVQFHVTNGKSKVFKISQSEFALVTWGESIFKYCEQSKTEMMNLSPGVYSITVPEVCSIASKNWKITNIQEGQSKVSIFSLTVNVTPVNIFDTLPEHQVIPKLKTNNFDELPTIARRTLKPLPDLENNDSLYDSVHEGFVSISVYILIFVGSCALLVGLCCYCQNRSKFFTTKGVDKINEPNIQIPQFRLQVREDDA